MTKRQQEPTSIEERADLGELKAYLLNLHGSKLLTIEETTTSHWLYLELYEYVDRILICDPYRNRLLSEGPKTDKIDARKLCLLLRAGLLKEVYHTLDDDYKLRKVISAYEDVVRAGVRLLNQRSAIYRAQGNDRSAEDDDSLRLVLSGIDQGIALYEETKARYEALFEKLCRKDQRMKRQLAIAGIGVIGAVRIVGRVVSAQRFPRAGFYLSYAGLIQHQKLSGQRSYGWKQPRFDRTLKAVYKTAALASLRGNGPMRQYYEMLRTKGTADHNARNAVARMIARISYGMLKNGTTYQPYKYRETTKDKKSPS